jgi:hypothetical protein
MTPVSDEALMALETHVREGGATPWSAPLCAHFLDVLAELRARRAEVARLREALAEEYAFACGDDFVSCCGCLDARDGVENGTPRAGRFEDLVHVRGCALFDGEVSR